MSKRDSFYYDERTDEWWGSDGAGIVDFPLPMPEVAGIFVGGCVAEGVGSSLHEPDNAVLAHAHLSGDTVAVGWICIRTPAVYHGPLQREILLHEYAHILVDAEHTVEWHRVFQHLLATITEGYFIALKAA